MSELRTFRDRVADFFKAHPHWIAATSFEAVGGRQGWRTRISECRRLGMHIDNRVRLVKNEQGQSFRLSEYRFLPAEPVEEPIPQTLPLEASVR